MHMRCLILFKVFALSSCTLLTPSVSTELRQLRAGQYHLDQSHAAIIFKANHLGLSSYIGRFNQWDARLDFNPEAMAAAKLSATVSTASVDTNNAKLEETLRGGSWFDSNSFPETYFESTEVLAEQDGFRFNGLLTLRGVTHPVSLYGEFVGGAVNRLNGHYTLGFRAEGSIKRSDFGIDNYLGMVADEVELEVHAEFIRQ